MNPSWRKTILPLTIALLFIALTAIIAVAIPHSAVETAGRNSPAEILVIDAGHGGLDGGAVSADGYRESEINLDVARRLFDLCSFFGKSCAMTRDSEALPYPPEAVSVREKKTWDQKRRVLMINAAEDAVLFSIHQNLYPDPRPSGTQVLYAATDGSAELGVLTHQNLLSCLCPDNRRLAIPAADSIYLLKSVNCPAILVECGFLSNPEETQKLVSPAYQKAIAAILCASYLQYRSAYRSL